jgi:hypothetical protein
MTCMVEYIEGPKGVWIGVVMAYGLIRRGLPKYFGKTSSMNYTCEIHF